MVPHECADITPYQRKSHPVDSTPLESDGLEHIRSSCRFSHKLFEVISIAVPFRSKLFHLIRGINLDPVNLRITSLNRHSARIYSGIPKTIRSRWVRNRLASFSGVVAPDGGGSSARVSGPTGVHADQ